MQLEVMDPDLDLGGLFMYEPDQIRVRHNSFDCLRLVYSVILIFNSTEICDGRGRGGSFG